MLVGVLENSTLEDVPSAPSASKQIWNKVVPSGTVTPPRVGSVHATVITPGLVEPVPPVGSPITFSFKPSKPKLPTEL